MFRRKKEENQTLFLGGFRIYKIYVLSDDTQTGGINLLI